MVAMPPAPAQIERNRFDEWVWRRDLKLRQVADALGCSVEHARAIRLPFGHEGRKVPGPELMEKIVAWTDGEVTAVDFYPPHLRGGAAAVNDDAAAPRPTGTQP
jgi:hypothetical protein